MSALRFAQLEELEQIGKGATSVVKLYRDKSYAEDEEHKTCSTSRSTLLAVKCVDVARARQDAAMVRQVMREKETLEALASAPHPCLVGFHGSCKDERNLYFMLDFVSGGDLSQHLQFARGGLPLTHVVPYTQQIASALTHLHGCGLIHRDLKANNVAIEPASGRCVLFDFGRAKSLRSPDERTKTMMGLGHHCAPELARSEPHGFPVDLWSLGVLLYELVVGVPPFPYVYPNSSTEQQEAVRADICSGAKHVLPAQGRLGELAQDLLDKLLSQEASARPAGAELVGHALFSGLERDSEGLAKSPAPLLKPERQPAFKQPALESDPFANW